MFPPEVERRLRGAATKALVDGFHEVDVGLNLGHTALREKISAEVQRLAAIKEAAKAAAKGPGAQGPASCGQAPQGMPVAQEAAIPAQDGQESQQDALQPRSPGEQGPDRRCAPSWESWAAAQGPEGSALCSGCCSGEGQGAEEEEGEDAEEEEDAKEEDAVRQCTW